MPVYRGILICLAAFTQEEGDAVTRIMKRAVMP